MLVGSLNAVDNGGGGSSRRVTSYEATEFVREEAMPRDNPRAAVMVDHDYVGAEPHTLSIDPSLIPGEGESTIFRRPSRIIAPEAQPKKR